MARRSGCLGGVVMRPHTDIAAWTERSCAAQGIEVKVTDPETLRTVAVLLRTGDADPQRTRSVARGEGSGRLRPST